jgi:predicted branched-subunit amino acid permease
MAATAAETTTSRGTLRDAAGIGIGVGVYGISFGVLAVAAGMSTAQACVMSMLVFTGASQFAFVGVLAGGGTARSSRSSRRSCAGPARRSPRSRGR